MGARTSEPHIAILAAIPGLKVLSAATAYDAKGLMKSSIRALASSKLSHDNDPDIRAVNGTDS